MAKIQQNLSGNFDDILQKIENGILSGSASASLEEESDFFGTGARCSVRVFERFSAFGNNRVSLSVTLFQSGNDIKISAITSGGSQAVLFKINTLGEEAFLQKLEEILENL